MDYTPPSTYLNLALSCHNPIPPVIASDLSPETVIDLLKDTTKARVERWHVRELEIWGSRQGWQDWRPWTPTLPGIYNLAEGRPTRSGLETGEMQRYIQEAKELWEFSEDDSDEVRRNLDSGHDGFLKLLLIASCPRLHNLRFAKRGTDPHTSLQWITKAVKRSRNIEKWPPGFESLRYVAVGIGNGLPSWEDENANRDGVDFAALLYIPKLERLYFNEMFQDRAEEDDGDFDLGEKYDFPYLASSVKQVFIDGASGFSMDFMKSITGVAKNLESAILRVGSEYAQDLDDVDSYVSTSDIELDGLYRIHEEPTGTDLAEYLIECFHPTIEAIYVWGRSDEHVKDSDPARPSEPLDIAIATVIESGEYKNLKVIYLDSVEQAHAQDETEIELGKPFNAGRKELAFRRSIAGGRKAGVHVCTLMNKDDGGYWKNFPARPDRFDLKTGPCGERPAS
ncbi:hypothetical protein F53441_12643 [Fusarium austroafricanum]|uniref:Uncharacterized protein n=1 Tax=Fusarium austroafricanum TaxID=2364996 RepID=A0A8H4NV51_9HYPO|nr:hypothetical protein F53441_12643 [Fusarium austroafricanum]